MLNFDFTFLLHWTVWFGYFLFLNLFLFLGFIWIIILSLWVKIERKLKERTFIVDKDHFINDSSITCQFHVLIHQLKFWVINFSPHCFLFRTQIHTDVYLRRNFLNFDLFIFRNDLSNLLIDWLLSFIFLHVLIENLFLFHQRAIVPWGPFWTLLTIFEMYPLLFRAFSLHYRAVKRDSVL